MCLGLGKVFLEMGWGLEQWPSPVCLGSATETDSSASEQGGRRGRCWVPGRQEVGRGQRLLPEVGVQSCWSPKFERPACIRQNSMSERVSGGKDSFHTVFICPALNSLCVQQLELWFSHWFIFRQCTIMAVHIPMTLIDSWPPQKPNFYNEQKL